MTVRRRLIVLAAITALLSGCRGPSYAPKLVYRWVYVSRNLLTDRNVTDVEAIMRRAKTAGYNGVVLADYKFQQLDRTGPHYFANVARIRRSAKGLGLDLYPTVCPIGYSSGLLSHDPNLAEGLPVRDALFIAHGGAAELAPDPPAALVNGEFEAAQGDRFAGWESQDYPGGDTFVDRSVRHRGAASIRMEGIGQVDRRDGHARVVQTVAVSPYRQYHLSVWVKTRGFEAPDAAHARILTPGGASLSFVEWPIAKTQDWTRYDAVFNSLDNRAVKVYLGVWEGKGGAIWWDDARLEEVGLLNVLRRPGCPLVVRGEDGTLYREGADYAPVRDPKLGMVPWAGSYDVYHTPSRLVIPAGSRIRDGARLRVSFYHIVIVHDDQVTCCLSEPKVYAILQDQIDRVNRLFHPKGFFMAHDEIRVANWCKACQDRRMSPGAMLADNVRRCSAMIRKASPRAVLFDWSDMFDPNHNAHGDYFHVNGSWAGSWKGLPRDLVVVNWYFEKRRKSLPWFAGLGHPQILAGYYDGPVDTIRDWLADARSVPNVEGVMYTTWANKYDDLEAFAKAAWGGAGSR